MTWTIKSQRWKQSSLPSTAGIYLYVPVFSFVEQAISLLSSTLFTQENLIDNSDFFTGTCGEHLWDPATIDDSDSMAVPTPDDPKRNVSDIHSGYLFQSAVSRFCSKPNHVPVPIITGHDKANLSWQGDFLIAQLILHLDFSRADGSTIRLSGAYLAACPTFPSVSTKTRQRRRKNWTSSLAQSNSQKNWRNLRSGRVQEHN